MKEAGDAPPATPGEEETCRTQGCPGGCPLQQQQSSTGSVPRPAPAQSSYLEEAGGENHRVSHRAPSLPGSFPRGWGHVSHTEEHKHDIRGIYSKNRP